MGQVQCSRSSSRGQHGGCSARGHVYIGQDVEHRDERRWMAGAQASRQSILVLFWRRGQHQWLFRRGGYHGSKQYPSRRRSLVSRCGREEFDGNRHIREWRSRGDKRTTDFHRQPLSQSPYWFKRPFRGTPQRICGRSGCLQPGIDRRRNPEHF